MLKLLIVEDEKWEREGLMDFLDWESLGIDLSGAACDGFEGIDKARVLRPDIIITDIKMPGMDGLKMGQSIREFIPDVKIIILTGYDDFKLAREAINMNANAYILKPVEEEELLEILKKIADECVNDAKKKEEHRMLKELLDESFVASRRELLLGLLDDKASGDTASKDIAKQASSLGILPSTGIYSVIAVEVFQGDSARMAADPAGDADHTGKADTAGKAEHMGKTDLAVDLEGADAGLRSDLVKVGINFATAVTEDNRALFILAVQRDISSDVLRHAAGAISDYYNKRGVSTITGIGAPVEGTAELYRTSRQAREALDFAYFWREEPAVDYSELAVLQQENAAKTGEFLAKGNDFTKQLMNALRAGDSEKIGCLLDELFRLVEKNKWLDKNIITNFLYGLLNETSLLFRAANLQEQEEGTAGMALLNLTDYDSMKEQVFGFFGKASKAIRDRKNNKDEYIVKRVVQLIAERYNMDISIKTIAAEVYLSPNYLGSIFRKCTGVQLNDYLCQFRMEKAKELLLCPKNKVSKVAREVGIPNVSYFCQVFRETFGVAPGEYQEINKLY